MPHLKAPFAGPVWSGPPKCGQITPGLNGAAVRGPDEPFEILWLSTTDSGVKVYVHNNSGATVGNGGLPLTETPQYIPCHNLSQLYFVAENTAVKVNYFGW